MTIRQRVEERAAQSALAAAAKNLLLKGLEPEFIAQNIGLSLEDVKKIKETIH